MTTRIEPTDGYRWDSHTAWVHLRKDWQQLSVDAQANANARVIAADKAAVVESRRQIAQAQGQHLVDVTV
jgi:hypothetical protein